MAIFEFKNVVKTYNKDIVAVHDLNLRLPDGEFTVIVGPSGCGKSTVLRMMAGLEEISAGDIIMDGKVINSVPPQKRDVAMVFQSYALYPHLSVYDNLAFPLKIRKMKAEAIDIRVREIAEVIGLIRMLGRMPRELSGGQRQRVALGRAMVREPKAFLLDEPLSNLDAALRSEMRIEIAELHRRLKLNFIYVTHDQVEALTLGQKIVVLKEGKLQQYASPEELYYRPANTFVAGFIGSPPMNFITADIRIKGDQLILKTDGLEIPLSAGQESTLQGYHADKLILGIRPVDLSISAKKTDGKGALEGKFLLKESIGDETLYYFDVSCLPKPLVVKETGPVKFEAHASVSICFDARKIHLFDIDTSQALGHEGYM